MTWVIHLILAGLMTSPGSGLSVSTAYNAPVNVNATQVVRLDETERFEQTYPLSAAGRVSVSNVNGSITVEAWDRSEVRLEAVKTADTKENLADVQIKIDARPDFFSVETDYGWKRNTDGSWKNKNHGRIEVQYRLSVPRGAVLDEIETVNGSVAISNMTNSTKASAVNGNVRATNLRGTARISTVNGTTEADFDSLSDTGQISLETVNGRVVLTIPSDASATVKADTVNGNIVNDFGLPVRKGEYVGRDLYGKLGGGDVRIKLNSVNGELAIRRKQDGKAPSPAVNLLPQKSKADENWNNDSAGKVNTAKINRDIARSIKESQKVAEAAMKDAAKELEKLAPELEKINAEAVREAVNVVNADEIKEQVRRSQARERETLARLGEVNWAVGAPAIEKKNETFKVKGTPKVTVDAKSCSVTVKGWDKPEVQYFITKISRPPQALKFKAEQKGDSEVNIKVEDETAPAGAVFGDASRIRLEVFVPKKSNLRILSNREIRLENVSGEIQLDGGDEAVNVRDADGRLRVSTADGSIRIIGFTGILESKTVDGSMSLEGDFEKINAQTVDGMIVLTLPENANASIESNYKELETQGLELVRMPDKKDVSVWKAGNSGGGRIYRLYASADGQVFIRGLNNLQTGF